MNEHREVELKLAIHADDVAAFRRLPLLRERCVDGPTRRKVFNLYLDTAEATLERHAMELRLRKIGGKWLQTLKTAGATGGALQQRGEWEFEQPSAQIDLALFRETPLADLAHARQLHQRLKPAFTTVFQRTIWLIEWAPGQRVEVALDLGAIHSGQRQAAIAEVEIELVAGDVATVFEVARSLLEQIALMPESRGKALRGYQLFRPRPSNPVSGESITLERDWSQGQVMRAIAAACNRHFAANLSGALDSDNPEFIHQLRVSLRTLRSALHLFKPAAAPPVVAELKWLTAALCAARDWDVLVIGSLPALLDACGDASLASNLLAAATEQQRTARAAARSALTSSRAAHLRLAIERWIALPDDLTLPDAKPADADAATPPQRAPHLADLLATKIGRRQQRLIRHIGRLADLSASERHHLRIVTKRLRYALEFSSSLFHQRRVHSCLKALSQIQRVLGETNDMVVAMRLLESLPITPEFNAFARGWFAAQSQRELAVLPRHFADLKHAGRWWLKKANADAATDRP